MTQIQPRQTSIEGSASGDDYLDSRRSNGGAVVVRVGKRGCALLRHPLHLIRGAPPSQMATAKTRRMGDQLRSSYATSEAGVQFQPMGLSQARMTFDRGMSTHKPA